MLINFQFPIIDLRSFSESDNRLVSPSWPAPWCDEFVRSFGGIKRRYLGTAPDLDGSKVCFAKKAVRFDPHFYTAMQLFNLIQNINCKIKLKYRRYYFDGYAAGKYEFGFTTWGLYKNMDFHTEIDDFINSFMNLNIRVFIPTQEPVKAQFSDFHNLFPKLLPYSTSSLTDIKDNNINEKLFLKLTPLIFLQLTKEEDLPEPGGMKKISIDYLNSEIYHKYYDYQGTKYQLIVFIIPSGKTDPKLRYFRIYLNQMHYLKESVYGVLKATGKNLINPENSESSSNLYQEFFKEKLHYLKKKSADIDNDILELALSTTDLLEQGPREELLRYLKKVMCIRPNIYKNIERMLDLLDLANNKKETVVEKSIYNIQQTNINNSSTYNDIDMVYEDFKSKVDWQRLSDELLQLKNELSRKSSDETKKEDIDHIEKAITQAKEKNGKGVLGCLSKVGKYCLDVAKEIGVDVVTSVIKKSLGVG
jgi:hypothetical protein